MKSKTRCTARVGEYDFLGYLTTAATIPFVFAGTQGLFRLFSPQIMQLFPLFIAKDTMSA